MTEQINTKESNKYLIITGIIIAVLAIGLITNGFGIFSPSGVTGGAISGAELNIGTSPVLGDLNAPVTIYEFSDFSCSYCRKFALETMPQIEKEYIETGKVKIVFKYAPGHGAGRAAHIVGYALSEQNNDLFWEFQNKAFSNQNDVGDIEKMKSLAESIGADMEKLNEFIDSNKANFLMQQDVAMAQSAGIEGTPSFVINGELLVGAQPFSEFKKVIDSKL